MFLLLRKPRVFEILWDKFDALKKKAMRGQIALAGLAFCFSAAAIAGALGLSPAYGAFLSGLALGYTGSRQELEEHTKPIFDVTIMVFFLSIGLLIDLQFLWDNIVATLSLLFITMLLKTILNFYVLRWQGMKKEEAYITGAALSQVGEFSFILAAIGLSAGTIENEAYKYVVAIISLSLLATPLWLYLVEKRGVLKHLNLANTARKRKTSPNKSDKIDLDTL